MAASFSLSGNTACSNERLISSASGWLILLMIRLRIGVGMLFGPVVLLGFRVLICFFISSIVTGLILS